MKVSTKPVKYAESIKSVGGRNHLYFKVMLSSFFATHEKICVDRPCECFQLQCFKKTTNLIFFYSEKIKVQIRKILETLFIPFDVFKSYSGTPTSILRKVTFALNVTPE